MFDVIKLKLKLKEIENSPTFNESLAQKRCEILSNGFLKAKR